MEWRLGRGRGELLTVEAWQVLTVCKLLTLLGMALSLCRRMLCCECKATSCLTCRTSPSSACSFSSNVSFSPISTCFSRRSASHSLISFLCWLLSAFTSSMRSATCWPSRALSLSAFSSFMLASRLSKASQLPIRSSSKSMRLSSSSSRRRTSFSSTFLLRSKNSSSCILCEFSLAVCSELRSWLTVSRSSDTSKACEGSGEWCCAEGRQPGSRSGSYFEEVGYFLSKTSSWRLEGDLKEVQEGCGLFLGERCGERSPWRSAQSCSGEVMVYSLRIQIISEAGRGVGVAGVWCVYCIIQRMSLGEIGAVEQLMRLALTGQQHLDALVGYYRGQIDRFNDERAEWALHYEQLKSSAANKYGLQQQLDRSRHRTNQLEAALNTTKAALNAERQQYFQMLEDSQAVKSRLDENRKRYRELVAVCKPISVAKHRQDRKGNSGSRLSSSGAESSIREGGEAELELINLGKQHDQRRAGLQRQIEQLKEELEEILSQHSARGRSCSKEYRSALEGLAEAESKIMQLTSEYFKLRMGSYEEERRVQEENEILRLKAVALAKKLQLLRESHSQELRTVEQEVKQRNKEFRAKYDEELRKKEEHLAMLKEQNEKINHIYLLKLKKMEAELKEVTERQKAAEEKGRSEISSLKGQIRILKGRLEYEGVREMRAEMAGREDEEEDSSGTLSMSELQNLNREVAALQRKI